MGCHSKFLLPIHRLLVEFARLWHSLDATALSFRDKRAKNAQAAGRQDHHQKSQRPSSPLRKSLGCGEEQGTGVVRKTSKSRLLPPLFDRLLHMDEMDQEALDGYLQRSSRSRRRLLRASSFMGVLRCWSVVPKLRTHGWNSAGSWLPGQRKSQRPARGSRV